MHELVDGMCVTCRPIVARYNPAELRKPDGKWTKTPGGLAKKLRDVIDSGDSDDDALMDAFDALDADSFGQLDDRLQKDVHDELDLLAKSGDTQQHKDRARAKLAELAGKAAAPKRKAPAKKSAPPKPAAAPPPAPAAMPPVPKASVKPGRFNADNAATHVEALDAAPTRVRALYEAGLTPAERRKFLAEVDAMSDKEADRTGGRGARAALGPDQQISIEDRDRIHAAADEYMQKAYIPINESLYTGKTPDPQTRQQIEDLDRLIDLTRTSEDAILHRGTHLGDDLPDEMDLPGFTSLTHNEYTAESFVRGDLYGAEAGGKGRTGTPTVITFHVPKGTRAVQLSPQDVLGEVLLHRGARVRKVADDGVVYGIRRVTYEVVS